MSRGSAATEPLAVASREVFQPAFAGGISVAHSASCGFTSPSKTELRSERHNSEDFISVTKFTSPRWGSGF
jgi:hypothetical protein